MARKLDILRRSPLTERALQVHRRHMEELIHQAHAEPLESTALALFEWAHPGQGFVEFLATRRLSPLAQRHNGRGSLPGRQPLVKMPHFTPDQILRHESRLLAGAAVRCDNVFQSVYIIEKHIFQRTDGGSNIAWHGHINKEHGAIPYAAFTCPRICGSPSTSESRLEATRKRCRTASMSCNWYRWGTNWASGSL